MEVLTVEKILAAKVEKGINLLDQTQPGWWRHIIVDRLDISSPTRCVLGQLYGMYEFGALALWPADLLACGCDRVVARGQNCRDHGFDIDIDAASYAILSGVWKERIVARQRELVPA